MLRLGWRAHAALATITPGACLAQTWTSIVLHQPAYRESRLFAAGGGRVGGYIWPTGTNALAFGAVWNVGAGPPLSVPHPAGGGSIVFGLSETQAVGATLAGATLWNGPAYTYVDLHPTGFTSSQATAVASGQQVGRVGVNMTNRAALWYGSAGSFVNLSPVGTEWSECTATDGVRQGGWVDYLGPGTIHAALWSGTASSMVDLDPGAGFSMVLGMGPGMQVGFSVSRAGYWRGTAQSWVGLHPIGAPGDSEALATDGVLQVGWSNVQGSSLGHAGVWAGTAASFVDLHQFLPPGYVSSTAVGITHANGLTYIAGSASRNFSTTEAVVWVIPGPGGWAVIAGVVFVMARKRVRAAKP